MNNNKGIDNIFTALVREKTTSSTMEFVLWCITCVTVLMSLIVAIVGHGKVTWILMMLFAIGLGVITAFRLKPIAMLYGSGVFNFLLAICHFANFRAGGSSDDYYVYSASALNIVLFVLEMLVAVAIVTIAFIHFFSRVRLGTVLTILMCVDTGIALFLHIMMFAAPFTGPDENWINEITRNVLNSNAYWLGTVTYWVLLTEILLYYIFFFWGPMDSTKGKILKSLNGPGGAKSSGGNPGLMWVTGSYVGRTIPASPGQVVTIGSAPNMSVPINSLSVSPQHCAVRFNPQSGFYEVYNNSDEGVYVQNGGALRQGAWNNVRRGEVIILGNGEESFRLL